LRREVPGVKAKLPAAACCVARDSMRGSTSFPRLCRTRGTNPLLPLCTPDKHAHLSLGMTSLMFSAPFTVPSHCRACPSMSVSLPPPLSHFLSHPLSLSLSLSLTVTHTHTHTHTIPVRIWLCPSPSLSLQNPWLPTTKR
jgi:hypothetical protein